MKVTELLKDEHKFILKKIDEAVEKTEHDMNCDVSYWEYFVSFLENYADNYHHAKEEKIYFKWLIANSPGIEHGPIRCMLLEHESGRTLVSEMKLAIEKIKGGETEAWNNLKKNLIDYSNLLRDHINKENNVLYNIADNLDERVQNGDATMLPLFDEIDTKFSSQLAKFVK